jgi:hypothetical protein
MLMASPLPSRVPSAAGPGTPISSCGHIPNPRRAPRDRRTQAAILQGGAQEAGGRERPGHRSVEPDRISGFASPPTVDQFRPVASGSAMRDWPKGLQSSDSHDQPRGAPLLPLATTRPTAVDAECDMVQSPVRRPARGARPLAPAPGVGGTLPAPHQVTRYAEYRGRPIGVQRHRRRPR